MNANVVLGLIIVIFVILPMLMGSNVVYMFLSLGVGDLLANAAATNVTQLLSARMSSSTSVYNYVEIGLLIIAPIIVLLVSLKNVRGVSRFFQLIPALAATVVCFVLIKPMLTPALSSNVQNSHIYNLVSPYYQIAIVIGLLVSVIYLWLQRSTGLHSKPKA
jgi:hypothetical protein